jgi:hypothetical protein
MACKEEGARAEAQEGSEELRTVTQARMADRTALPGSDPRQLLTWMVNRGSEPGFAIHVGHVAHGGTPTTASGPTVTEELIEPVTASEADLPER